jgi:eukaryotic-like serine/threonine-protein kinase
MPSETSNSDLIPATATAHPQTEGSDLSPPHLVATQYVEVAHTALTSIQSSPAQEGPPPTQQPGNAGTVAQEQSTGAGGTLPRPSGRFPRYLGEYELIEEIARGGMGVVYRARQEKLNRLVALKLIRSGSLAGVDDLRRFRQEAEAIADLDHPHIIPIYEIGQDDDQPYFSMKLIEGGNLTRHIPRLKEDPGAVAALMVKVARAVHYAHQRTILHRDIKPSNILLDERDEPYVTDFGLAKRIGPESGTAATVTGAVMGTPAYMPPEQARGGTKSVTTAADIYSLGATLYEALTGQPPFAGDSSAEIMRLVLDQEPVRPRSINPKLDRDLETICMKCLEKEPSRRYGSAEALAEDLERWHAGIPISARRVPVWERGVKWVKRRRALATLALLLLVTLVGLIGGGLWFTLQLGTALDLANRGRFAADMNLARRALDDGLIYQVRDRLKAYQNGSLAAGDLRGFEWYYLANLCDRTPTRLRGHVKAVICVAFHPNGDQLVSGGDDGTVRIWDLNGRQAPHVFQGTGGVVHCVAVSPNGRWLAAGDERGGLRLWELETAREQKFRGHESGLRSVAFSSDSGHLLSSDAAGVISQWDVMTGERDLSVRHRHEYEGAAPVGVAAIGSEVIGGTLAAYAPDDQTIVSVGMDHWVMIWDVATRRKRDQIQAGGHIFGFSIGRVHGFELALAELLPGIEIFNLEKLHEPRRRVPGVSRQVGAVAFGPGGRTLALAGYDGAGLLDAKNGQILDLFGRVNRSPFALAFGTDGRMLAMAVGHEIHLVRLDHSLKGETVAASLGPIVRLAVSQDERLLPLGREDGAIVVSGVLEKRVLHTLTGHGLPVLGVAFIPGPDGARLVSVGADGLILIWNADSDVGPIRTLVGGSGAVYSVAVRPDGRQIAAGGEDGLVRTWDPATGRADLPPLDHGAPVSALAYDRSGSALASGGMDRTVRLWSATSGRRLLGPLSHPHQLTGLEFSPDGRFLAGGGGTIDKGGTIVVWHASSGKISAEVDCARGVDSLSFSPDSRRIATCGSDAVVQVWDPTGGHETLALDGHGDRVSAIRFAPRDLRLYSAGRDGVVKLWDGSRTAPAQ